MSEPKQHFTPEFRAEAVRLAETSGRSRRDVAADLGVELSTLNSRVNSLLVFTIKHLPRSQRAYQRCP